MRMVIDNVIYVNFSNPTAADRLLSICKEELDPDDYADLLDALVDVDFYQTCDGDIQDLVDAYWGALGS